MGRVQRLFKKRKHVGKAKESSSQGEPSDLGLEVRVTPSSSNNQEESRPKPSLSKNQIG